MSAPVNRSWYRSILGRKLAPVAVSLMALWGFNAAHAAQTNDATPEVFNAEEQAAIEQIVHDYLLSHPEILVDTARALEEAQQQMQQQMISTAIDELRTNEMIPVRGDRNAKHYLIEFYDVNCGYCKVVRPYTHRLAEEGVAIFYIEFPILSETSVKAAAIGLALYQQNPEQYFAYQEQVMTYQGKIDSENKLRDFVTKAGADYDRIAASAMTDVKIQRALRANMVLGQNLGVRGTPFFVLDGEVIRGAIKDYSVFADILNRHQ